MKRQASCMFLVTVLSSWSLPAFGQFAPGAEFGSHEAQKILEGRSLQRGESTVANEPAKQVEFRRITDTPPSCVREYIDESMRQWRHEIERVQYSSLPANERHARIDELRVKPYYAKLYVDTPLEVGQMGVLPSGVTARAFRVVDEWNMLVELSWRNDHFQTDYHRLIWAKGFSTRRVEENATVSLPGVVRVVAQKTYTTRAGEKDTVPVVEVLDVSRYMDEEFRQDKANDELLQRFHVRVEDARDREATIQAARQLALDELNRKKEQTKIPRPAPH